MKKEGLTKLYNRSLLGPLAVGVIVFALPFVFSANAYILSTLILIGIYALVCTGLNLLMGYAGQISLGQAAFYGIGAYASAYMTVKMGTSPIIGIVVGIIISAIIAVIIGIPTFKLKENYLALATLGFCIIVYTFFKEWKDLTGGLNGFFGIPKFEVVGFAFTTQHFYFLVWFLVIAGIIFARNIIQSRIGRALQSIHGSEVASDSIGVNIQNYKLQTFVISAVYASVAGSLYAHYSMFINPELFDAMQSIMFLIMVVIGGVSSVWGGLIGAVVYVFLSEWLKDLVPMFLPNAGGEFETVFFGLLLVIILIYMPNGLAHPLSKLFSFIGSLFKKEKNEPLEVQENSSHTMGGDKS